MPRKVASRRRRTSQNLANRENPSNLANQENHEHSRIADRMLDATDATLLDLVDRLLSKGVVASGDVTLGVAGVDLIYLRLSALLCAADRVLPSIPRGRARPRRRKASSLRKTR